MSEVPVEIYGSGSDTYFLVFDLEVNNGAIGRVLKKCSKNRIIDVAYSDYLDECPNQELDGNEALFFNGANIVYLRLSKAQLGSVLSGAQLLGGGVENTFPSHDSTQKWPAGENPYWAIGRMNLQGSPLTGKGVNVAILDTGIQFAHEQFKNRQNLRSQFFTGNSAGDTHGHGTFCAGLLAGHLDSEGYRFGVAHGCNLFVGKVIHGDYGETVSILKGIFWALRNNCRVVSISIEEPFSNTQPVYDRAFRYAKANGALCFVPAGNGSKRPRKINGLSVPRSSKNAITVGAINCNDEIYHKSNRALDGQKIDLVAPGERVYSSQMVKPYGSPSYGYDSGTSMAVPLVAGSAALLWEKYPDASAEYIRTQLLGMAERKEQWNEKDVGKGIVNFKNRTNRTQLGS